MLKYGRTGDILLIGFYAGKSTNANLYYYIVLIVHCCTLFDTCVDMYRSRRRTKNKWLVISRERVRNLHGGVYLSNFVSGTC